MSLQVWLPLNGSTINQGIAGFEPAAEGITYATSGKIGAKSCSGGSLSMPAAKTATILNNQAITIAFWIKPLANGSAQIFGNDNGMGANNNRKFALWQYPTGQDFHWSWMNDAAKDTFTDGSVTGACPLNTWTHLCITYNNPNVTVYVNGEQRATASGISNSSTFAYDTTILHSNSNRNINDFRIYDHCLSPREVKLLSQGLVAHYKLDRGPNLLLNSYGEGTKYSGYYNYTFDYNGFGRFLTSSDKCTLTICFTPSTQFQKFRPHFANGDYPCTSDYPLAYDSNISNNKKQIITLNVTPSFGNTTPTTSNGRADLRLYVRRNSDSAYDTSVVTIHWVSLQYGDNLSTSCWTPAFSEQSNYYNQEYDYSGYNNHATRSSLLTTTNTPRYTHCAQFNGNINNKIIYASTAFNFTDNFSWSCWVKHNYTGWNKSDASYAFTVGRADTGGYGYGLEEVSATSMRVRFGNSNYIISIDENWHHVAFTKSGTTIIIYVDGTPTNYTFRGTLPTYSDGSGLGLGHFYFSGGSIYPYCGALSDFRIYATTLSAAAVKKLYQSSISFLDNGTLQCSEIIENPTNLKYNQNGMVQANQLNEIGYIDKMNIKTLSDGSAWARIYWLDVSSNATYFTNEAEVKYCINQSNRFSLMGYVEYFKSKENKYEFMLTYPALSSTGYNRWRQTSSPNASRVTGYEPVSGQISWSAHCAGLRAHNPGSCIYNCDTGDTWYAPIGQLGHGNWNGAGSMIPAANGSNTSSTELWVRIDNLPKLTKLSMFNGALQAHQIYEL